MRLVYLAPLYTAFVLLANEGLADTADLMALREGDMRKLNFHSAPEQVSDTVFMTEDGDEATLADSDGKVRVVNFWATWCAPCRHEMPQLADLQTQLGGDAFEVITIATGRNPRPAMEDFFAEIGVDNLPLHTDARSGLARSMGVLGLPVTVILDREGHEIARLQGDAEWNSDNALAILQAVIDAD